jgi:hypothetical protein
MGQRATAKRERTQYTNAASFQKLAAGEIVFGHCDSS